MFEVKIIFRVCVPGQVEQRIDVVGLYAELCSLGIHAFQFAYFLDEGLLDVFGPLFGAGFPALLVDFFLVRIGAQFVLNLLHLLLEEILALLALYISVRFFLYFIFHLQHIQFAGKVLQYPARPLLQISDFQQCLFFSHAGAHVGGNEVDEKTQRIDVFNGHGSLGRNLRRNVDDLQ